MDRIGKFLLVLTTDKEGLRGSKADGVVVLKDQELKLKETEASDMHRTHTTRST